MPGSGGKGGQIKAGGAYVELSADDAGLRSGLDKARKAVLGFSKKLAIGGAAATGVGAAIMAPILVSFHNAVDHITEIRKAAEQLNIPTEMMSGLGYAASKVGVDLDGVVKASRHVEKAISEAGEGSGAAADLFKKMGIDAKDLASKSLEDQFLAIADGLKNIPNEADRTAAAMDIMGKSGVNMLPILRKGSAGLKEFFQQAKEAGAIVSSDDAAKAKTYTKAIGQARESVKYFWEAVGSAVLEVVGPIKEASDIFVMVVRTARRFVEENRGMVLSVLAVGAVISAVGTGLITLGSFFALAAVAAGGFVTVIGFVGSALAFLVSTPVLIAAAIVTLGAVLVAAAADFGMIEKASNSLGKIWEFLLPVFEKTWGGIRDALAAGDLSLALKVASAGISVVWQGMVVEMTNDWNDFKSDWVDGWHDIVTAVKVGAVQAAEAWRKEFGKGKASEFLLGFGTALGTGTTGSDAVISGKTVDEIYKEADKAQAERDEFRKQRLLDAMKQLDDAQKKLDDVRLEAEMAKRVKLITNLAMLGLAMTHGSGGPAAAARAGMAAMSQGSFSAINAKQAFGSRRSPLDKIEANTARTADAAEEQVKQGGAKFG